MPTRFLLFFFLPLLMSCNQPSVVDFMLIADFGDYSSINEAGRCEDDVDWYDASQFDDSNCTLAFASQELQHYLSKIYRQTSLIPVVKPNNVKPAKWKVIIANLQYMEPYQAYGLAEHIGDIELKPQGYLIKTIHLDGQQHILIVGGDRVGALYGVYAFLEILGVRWYGLGEDNEIIPQLESITMPTLNLVDEPAFITRGFWARDDRGHEDFFNWMARNRINVWSYAQPQRGALKKRGINFLTGGHQIQEKFLHPDSIYPYKTDFKSEHSHDDPYPRSQWFAGDRNDDGKLSYSEAHPEWYGLIDGKRSFDVKFKYGTNFCTSNQAAVSELSRNFIQDLVTGEWSEADMINFWPSDVGKWCECEQCRALGEPTDRMLLLLHQVRGELERAQVDGVLDRNIILTAPAYLETRVAPTRSLPENFDYINNVMTFFPIERCYAHALNDATCTDINHHHNKDMESWMTGNERYYKGTMFLGEYYNISLLASLPMVFTQVMSQDLPYYYQSGIRHMHYMHAETVNWGSMLLTNYLFAKLLWNPSLDSGELLDELYVKYYGDAAAIKIKSFYHYLELAMSSMKTIRWAGKSFTENYSLDKKLNDNEAQLFTTDHLQYQPLSSASNDGRDLLEMVADIKQARHLIDQLLKLDHEEKYRMRIAEVERRFAYGEAMVHFYDYLVQTHQAHHAGNKQAAINAFMQLKPYADELKRMTDIIKVVGGTLKAGDGFTATFNQQTYERYEALYGRP